MGLFKAPVAGGLSFISSLSKKDLPDVVRTRSCLYLMTRKRNVPNMSAPKWDTFDRDYVQITDTKVVYVDGLTSWVDLSCPETTELYNNFARNMFKEFVVEDWGICDAMLEYKVDFGKSKGILELTQKGYLMVLLDWTDLEECKPKYAALWKPISSPM